MGKNYLISVVLSIILVLACTSFCFAAGDSPANATNIIVGETITDAIQSTTSVSRSGYYRFVTPKDNGITYFFNVIALEKEWPESSYLSSGVMDSAYQYVKDLNEYPFGLKNVYGIGQVGSRGYILEPNSTYYFRVESNGGLIKYQASITTRVNVGTANVKSVKAGKKKLTVKYASGEYAEMYQIQLKKNGGKWKTAYTGTALKKTIKKLKKGAKYKVRVRSIRNVDGKSYASSWSKASAYVKIK